MATERTQIAIDRFGRVVLPKEIRDRLGVSAGTEFEVEEQDDAILLKPVFRKAKIVNEGGWLVVESEGETRKQGNMVVLCDTSALVPSFFKGHIHHSRTFPVFQKITGGKIVGVVAQHSLAECFSSS